MKILIACHRVGLAQATRWTHWAPAICLLALPFLMLEAGCSREARQARYLRSARQHYAAREYEKAVIECRNALRLDDQNGEAVGQMGLIYAAQSQWMDAFPFLKRAVELSPANNEFRLSLATFYFVAGDYPRAREHLTTLLKQGGTNDNALKLWACSATTPEEVEEALERLRAAEATFQDKSRYQVLLGLLYKQKEDKVSAEEAFRTAVRLDPGSKDARLILGDLYTSESQTNLANTEYENAARLNPTNGRVWFEWAEFKRKTGDLEASRKLLGEMVQRTPELADGWFRLAQIAASEGDLADTGAKLDKALRIQPAYLEAIVLKQQLQLATNGASAAVNELERLSAQYPRYAPFQYLLAQGCLRNRELGKALKAAQKAVTLATNYTDAVLLLAELEIRTGDTPSAIALLEQTLARHPNLVRGQVLLGSAYLAGRRPAQAVEVCRRVTEQLPTSGRAWSLLGLACFAKDDPAGAAECFEKALSLNPHDLDALTYLVELNLAEHKYQAASERIRRQLDVLPTEVSLHLLLARAQVAQRDLSGAAATYRKAIELSPEKPRAYHMLSQLLVASGLGEQALQVMELALAKTSNDVATLSLAGSLYQKVAGDADKARSLYERVLALQPDSVAVANNLAGIYLQRFQNPERAAALAAKAYSLAPDQPAVQDTYGWVLFHRADYKRAFQLLSSSAKAAPKEPEILFHLGLTQAMLGMESLGLGTLERTLNLATNFPGAELAALAVQVLRSPAEQPGSDGVMACQQLLRLQPSNSPAQFRLILAQENSGRFEETQKALESLVDRNPYYYPALLRLAEIKALVPANLESALSLARKAKELAPEEPEALCRVAKLALLGRERSWGLSMLSQAASLAGNNPTLLAQIAEINYREGREDEARTALDGLLTLHTNAPTVQQARLFRDCLDPKAPDKPDALDRANQALAQYPKMAAAGMMIARVYHQRGRSADERTEYERWLKSDPTLVPAIKGLLVLGSTAQPPDVNYELAQRARELLPGDPEVARALAFSLFCRQDYKQAANLFEESARKVVPTAQSLYYQALCKAWLGDKAAARRLIARATQLDPSAKPPDAVVQLMADLQSGALSP
jgi:tetratricopeptide (TPR) repeat protein